MAKHKWMEKDSDSCIYCWSENVEHWVTAGHTEVVHRCLDCKQQWSEPLVED